MTSMIIIIVVAVRSTSSLRTLTIRNIFSTDIWIKWERGAVRFQFASLFLSTTENYVAVICRCWHDYIIVIVSMEQFAVSFFQNSHNNREKGEKKS